MADRRKPDTTEEMIQQIWYAVYGANGEGIAAITKRNRDDIKQIKDVLPELLTKTEHIAHHDACEDKERRTSWRRTDVVLAIGMLITAIASVAAAV